MTEITSNNVRVVEDTRPANPLHYLGPSSYTAQRLLHATPEHLYLTTRRCFIGPIPEGWLKTHRRDWYKHHLHIHYSSRTASFQAAASVGQHSRLTGLDTLGTSEREQDSPRPVNLTDDDAVTENGDGRDGPHISEVVVDKRPAVDISRLTEGVGEVPAEEIQTKSDPPTSQQVVTAVAKISQRESNAAKDATPQDPSSLTESLEPRSPSAITVPISQFTQPKTSPEPTLKSALTQKSEQRTWRSTRSKMSRLTSEGSFVTASETPVSSIKTGRKDNNQHKIIMDGQEDYEGDPGDVRDSTLGSISRNDSTAQLIHAKVTNKDQPESSTTGVPARMQNVPPSRAHKGSTRSGVGVATSGGLVRFNLPDDDVQTESMLKLRLTQHRRRDVLMRGRKDKQAMGEIVKMEKMLVRVEVTAHELSKDFDENDTQKIESRIVDNWREFMVVCRKSTTDEAEYTLQMYKSRVIPATERTQKKATHEIVLKRRLTNVNLFSSLDKTMAIWEPFKRAFRIYIMRPRSGARAMEWFTFLRSILGWQRTSLLQINVPDLSVSMRVDHPFKSAEDSKNSIGDVDADGDTLTEVDVEERAIAGDLVSRCMEMLENSPEWSNVVDEWAIPSGVGVEHVNAQHRAHLHDEDGNRPATAVSSAPTKRSVVSEHNGYNPIGLAWKRYDRLEWVHGANEKSMYGAFGMERTHELELRPKQHYPTSVTTVKGEKLIEPPPIEGFLIRLTSQKGAEQKLGKLFFKRLYFSTHNQFLIFNRPAQADPPPPPQLPMQANSKIPTSQQIQDKIPVVYAVNPYPIVDEQIGWLNNFENTSVPEEVVRHDQEAYDENERKINLLLKCDGLISLTNVVSVRHVHRGATPADEDIEEGSDADFNASVDDTRQDDGETRDMDDERTFELLLKNKLVIRLQSYDKATKLEWMNRLRALVKYWTNRASADTSLYKAVRRQNLEMLKIDEDMESLVGQFAHKWEVSQSYASPELYHMCGISCCRTVQMAGVLFRKPRLHASFRRSMVVLSHGKLLIFQDTLRSRSGKLLNHIHHERVMAIDLSQCYIYSGLITSNDLLYQGGESFEKAKPGHKGGLPRMYLEDGWSSTDEDSMTSFVIWHGRRKSWFRSEQAEEDSKDGAAARKLKLVGQLGKKGRSIVFKTRSRAERDHWVLSIGMEIERLDRGDDVRIVDKS